MLQSLSFFLLLLCSCWLWPLRSAKAQLPAHIDTAVSYFGPKELVRENHGPEIKKFLAATGLGEGYPWCAAFVSYCLEVAIGPGGYPRIRSALAQDFITGQSIKAKNVMRGQVMIPSGYIFVMVRGQTRFGHTGFVLLGWQGPAGITIEGNTGTGLPGEDEREGQGVWIRRRQIYTTCYFCIKYFTPVGYED